MTKIKITEFGQRHFDSKFGGTKILDWSIEDFEKEINNTTVNELFSSGLHGSVNDTKLMDGYAPFCKLLAVKNFTNARVGSLPITLENYQYLRSGYSARRDSELPTFSRWLELPVGKPKAEYLVLVLYSKEQIQKEDEHYDEYKSDIFRDNDYNTWCKSNGYDTFDADWGVVAILGQSHNNEEPMKPETMLRNALGIEEGGSGTPLDREEYLKSVAFWSDNATVK